METAEFYSELLGLESPWEVEEVKHSLKDFEVRIRLSYETGSEFQCSECGKKCAVYDHQAERTWRHLDTMQMKTFLTAPIPRTKCEEHGVKVARLSWAEKGSQFTLLFEKFAIEVLKECPKNRAAELLRISWDEADGVMRRAVRRGLLRRNKQKRKLSVIGVDETSSRKGHKYLTIVTNHDKSTVEHVTESRGQESLEQYYKTLTEKQKLQIKAVTMDMWDPYVAATRVHIEDADKKIVFDKFHVMKHLNEAVDKVRRGEHKALRSQSDQTLKGTKYLWLRNPQNMDADQKKLFKNLQSQNLQASRAWAIKESFRGIWAYSYTKAAQNFFKQWYFWATHSRLEPIKKVARTVKAHLACILNYCRLPYTNGLAESVNAKIQRVMRMACGFRNIENFKTAIYFHCGGLNLYPL